MTAASNTSIVNMIWIQCAGVSHRAECAFARVPSSLLISLLFVHFFSIFFLKKSHENHVFLSLSLALFDSLLFFALSSLHKLNRRKSKSFSKSERSARHRARACFFFAFCFIIIIFVFFFPFSSFMIFYHFFGFMSPIGFF